MMTELTKMEFEVNLPEDCISEILALTSPVDACRSSLVSSTFRSAMDLDAVWERFLPLDYHDILSRVVTPLKFSSKKELYLRLCDPILIDSGRKSFKLEKASGKISYTLSARELFIAWSDVPLYWSWIPTNESRFSEVARLRTTWWLEIEGKIRTQKLSTNTKYGAYLIMKISDPSYGLDLPSEMSVEVGNQVSHNIGYLNYRHSKKQPKFFLDIYPSQAEETGLKDKNEQMPRERDDLWQEIEMGEFFTGESDEEVKMSLMEVRSYLLKAGLVIAGMEIRPKMS